VSSTRPLPQAVDDAGPNGAGIETRPSTSVTVPVLDNDYNPFAQDGKPLTVLSAKIEQQVGTASVSYTTTGVTVKTGSGATGTLTVVYSIQDATRDPARQTQARVTFVIRNNPDAPNAPSASEGDGRATVSFTAPSSNNSPITGYTINWTGGGSRDVTSAGSYDIEPLNNGTGYAFTVTARNAIGESTASGPSGTVTPYGKPGVPASAALTASNSGNGALGLSWAPPGNTGGRGVTGYKYEWIGNNAGNGSTTGDRTASATGSANTPYQYKVQACNPRGCGDWTTSNTATPTTPPPPWAPSNNAATVTRTTCPESQASYDNNNLNSSHGCTDNSRGYLQAGTVVDAVCHSVRRGVHYFYFLIEDGSYNGWFIPSADTTRPDWQNIKNC